MPPDQPSEPDRFTPQLWRAGAAGLSLYFLWRVASAGYNGPHIDESLYYSMWEAGIGNEDWVSGNAYLWPPVAHLAHAVGGLFGVRVVTGLLVTLAGLFAGRIVVTIGGLLGWRGSSTAAGVVGAMVFCIASPVTVISSLGTYDALAAFFYVVGFERLLATLRDPGAVPGGLAAASLTLAAVTRYFYLPLSTATAAFGVLLALLAMEQRGRRLLFAGVLPLAATSAAVVFSWTHFLGVRAHLNDAIFNCCRTTADAIVRDAALLVPVAGAGGALCLLLLTPVLLSARPAPTASVMSRAERLLLLQFLAAGLVAPLVLHIQGGQSASLGRTLAVTALFGAVAIGLALAAGLSAVRSPRKRLRFIVASSSVLVLASVLTNVRVVDLGLRTMDARVQATGTWLDARPATEAVVARAAELPPGVTPGVLVLSAPLNVWELRKQLGAGVDTYAPYNPAPWEQKLRNAADAHLPLVVGLMTAEQARWVSSVAPELRVLETVTLPGVQPESAHVFGHTAYFPPQQPVPRQPEPVPGT